VSSPPRTRTRTRRGTRPRPLPIDTPARASARPPSDPAPAARPPWRLAGSWVALHILAPLIEHLFPAACPSCEKPLPGLSKAGLCSACWASIRPVLSPLCPRCGSSVVAPFPALAAFAASSPAGPAAYGPPAAPAVAAPPPASAVDRICGRCARRPPRFDAARCALVFEGAVRALLHLLKFDDRRDLAPLLGRAMLAALPPEEGFDLVIPVPLHWTRRLSRGYNQAALLAGRIARARRIPMARRVLIKTRRTADQAHLDADARRENLYGCFAVRAHRPRNPVSGDGRRAGSPLEGLRILLVDDVLTTGATAEACAQALKAAGAARVFVLAVARTPLRGGAVLLQQDAPSRERERRAGRRDRD